MVEFGEMLVSRVSKCQFMLIRRFVDNLFVPIGMSSSLPTLPFIYKQYLSQGMIFACLNLSNTVHQAPFVSVSS
jgi:hypothetical protein